MLNPECRICGGSYYDPDQDPLYDPDPYPFTRRETHKAHVCSAECLVADRLETVISQLKTLEETLEAVGSRRSWWKW